MSETNPSGRPAQARCRVLALEPDERLRTRMTLELAGIAAAPVGALDDIVRDLIEGEPAVVLFGASLANHHGFQAVQRIGRAFPETGVVLLVEELTLPLLQDALRAGVRDAVAIDAGEAQIRQAIDRVGEAMTVIANRAAIAASSPPPGTVVVAFSTKGGVGKSVVATNLSTVLATEARGRVALVDADLQFGDVAVLLGIPPLHPTTDAADAIDSADEQLLDGLLVTHEASSLRVLCAPVEPSAADKITPEAMVGIVRTLRRMFDFIVVDMPPHFDDVVLALIEEADTVLLVASMDIPSIKNLKVGIQTLDLLSLAGSKLRLVLNRANARVHLDVSDVERALGVTAEYRIPSDISIPQAVNRGVPVVLDKPRAPAAIALRAVAETFLPGGAPAAVAEPVSESESENRRRRRR
ncbi:MAG TPA: P-loop NTPase [Acidimicrobiia bacterium]|nr:P-loop NTPase [Acidimicrobiia bacterium]